MLPLLTGQYDRLKPKIYKKRWINLIIYGWFNNSHIAYIPMDIMQLIEQFVNGPTQSEKTKYIQSLNKVKNFNFTYCSCAILLLSCIVFGIVIHIHLNLSQSFDAKSMKDSRLPRPLPDSFYLFPENQECYNSSYHGQYVYDGHSRLRSGYEGHFNNQLHYKSTHIGVLSPKKGVIKQSCNFNLDFPDERYQSGWTLWRCNQRMLEISSIDVKSPFKLEWTYASHEITHNIHLCPGVTEIRFFDMPVCKHTPSIEAIYDGIESFWLLSSNYTKDIHVDGAAAGFIFGEWISNGTYNNYPIYYHNQYFMIWQEKSIVYDPEKESYCQVNGCMEIFEKQMDNPVVVMCRYSNMAILYVHMYRGLEHDSYILLNVSISLTMQNLN